jgi:hypothetical protein
MRYNALPLNIYTFQPLPEIKLSEGEWKELYATVGYDINKPPVTTKMPKEVINSNAHGLIYSMYAYVYSFLLLEELWS